MPEQPPDSQFRDADLLLDQAPADKKERFRKVADRAISGPAKRTAAIKLACLQCVNWDQPEVGRCTIKKCALWALRKG